MKLIKRDPREDLLRHAYHKYLAPLVITGLPLDEITKKAWAMVQEGADPEAAVLEALKPYLDRFASK
jgi:hypothetical protein